jgi:hypothetical protein
VVQHRSELEIRRDHQVEGGPRIRDVVSVDRRERAVQQVAESGIGKRRAETERRDAADEGTALIGDHDAVTADRRDLPQRFRHGLVRGEEEGGVEGHRLRLHPADGRIQLLQVEVLRKHREPPTAGESRRETGTGDRVHVRGDDRDRRTGAVLRRERHRQAAADIRMTRHKEDVGIGEVVPGGRLVKLHAFKGNPLPLGTEGHSDAIKLEVSVASVEHRAAHRRDQ